MARCRPVFPAFESSSVPAATLPSSYSTSITQPRQQHNLIQRAITTHHVLDTLPNELSPPSRSPSPQLQSRTALLRDKVAEVVSEAGSPASPSWVQVSRMLRMACTSRMYRSVPQGVRIGENMKVDPGNYTWVLPDTADEWERCEEQWKRRFLSHSKGEGQSSKYWPPKPPEPPHPEEDANTTPSKAELVRDKVRAWQATLATTVEEGETTAATVGIASLKVSAHAGVKEPGSRTKHSPRLLPVVESSATATGKKAEKAREITSRIQVDLSGLANVQIESAQSSISPKPAPTRIIDVPETSFLPPSFPTQLDTSTPPLPNKARAAKPRAKPSPILPLRTQESSLSSSPHLSNSVVDLAPPIASSSSQASTPKRRSKHSRPFTPPPDASSVITADERPLKKPRMGLEDSPIGQSSAQPPPSTPPLATSPHTPSPLVRKGLGNAKGVLIPSTPTNNALPTLTELLASTRRSRPRPRPPSRKRPATADAESGTGNAHGVREPSPAPTALSRAKTVFSSPASGSSGSPQSLRDRPRSPISPLFSSTFAPPFVSTQQGAPGAGGFGGMAASQAQGVGLAKDASGMVGMGYNSQFDLEGQIGEVSDLLERDVDFDGWLRDIPEVDADA